MEIERLVKEKKRLLDFLDLELRIQEKIEQGIIEIQMQIDELMQESAEVKSRLMKELNVHADSSGRK